MTEHVVHHPSLGDLLYPAINFGLFIFLSRRFLGGPIREYFRARTARLREALQAGDRARAEAESLRAELARQVADLPALQEKLRADIRASAERETETIRKSAEHAALRIRKEARELADQEVTAARQALRAEVAEEAIREATAMLREALNATDRDRLLREFIDHAGSVT